jgi:glyoxylase-like metal-dependent hydrolase (beta-lactamase superfamily II)
MEQIIENAWLLPLGFANAVVLRHKDELTLVDTGFAGKEQLVYDAIKKLGMRESDLKHIVLTHAHPDHLGSAGALLGRIQATTWIHEEDADIAEHGGPFRFMTPAKGLMQKLLYKMVWKPGSSVAPVRIDNRIKEGDTLPIAGGLEVIHTPGHCAGQVALLWQGTRLLIGADVGSNMLGLSDPLGFEDEALGHRSQAKLAKRTFDAAAFGHGSVIKAKASDVVRRVWGRQS